MTMRQTAMIAARLFVTATFALLASLAVLVVRQQRHLPVRGAAVTMGGVGAAILAVFSLVFACLGVRWIIERRA